MQLSILICTFNRCEILEQCLEHIEGMDCAFTDYEVLVIDNASTDKTALIVQRFAEKKGSKISYYFEERQGLSVARNSGLDQAKGEWICYIDDDMMLSKSFLSGFVNTVKNADFDSYGGRYTALWLTEKPSWLDADFGDFQQEKAGVEAMGDRFAHGCLMLFQRSILVDIGGFNIDLGMNGETVAYSEDSEIQFRLREAGYTSGFSSYLNGQHVISPHKFEVNWHLKSIYAMARDRMGDSNHRERLVSILFHLLKRILLFFPRALYGLIKIRSKRYYQENLFLDVGKPILASVGQLVGWWKYR